MTGALRMFALLAIVTLAVLAMEGRAAIAQQTVYSARAGAGAPGYSVNLFLPSTITVHAGDSIRWDFPWFEGHTVSFGQPDSGAPQSTPSPATYDGTGFVTSDLQFGPGRNYEVQFPNEGTFELWCVIHPGMRGTVQVVPASQPVDAQSAIDVAGEAQFQAALAELQEIAGNRAADSPQRRTLSDGTTEHTVIIAYSSDSGDVQQYFPPDVAVKPGDTVVWRSVVRAPHTVTFGPIPEGVPRPATRKSTVSRSQPTRSPATATGTVASSASIRLRVPNSRSASKPPAHSSTTASSIAARATSAPSPWPRPNHRPHRPRPVHPPPAAESRKAILHRTSCSSSQPRCSHSRREHGAFAACIARPGRYPAVPSARRIWSA